MGVVRGSFSRHVIGPTGLSERFYEVLSGGELVRQPGGAVHRLKLTPLPASSLLSVCVVRPVKHFYQSTLVGSVFAWVHQNGEGGLAVDSE